MAMTAREGALRAAALGLEVARLAAQGALLALVGAVADGVSGGAAGVALGGCLAVARHMTELAAVVARLLFWVGRFIG
jgi:hypothetical protein